ncbi:MAG: primosomal protein N' [Wenzhouxiangella sp.]
MIATARVAVAVPLPQLFDYLAPAGALLPPPGSRVQVPFGQRQLVGLVLEHGEVAHSAELKRIEQVLDSALLPAELLALLERARRYYLFPPGESLSLLLPLALRRLQAFRPTPPQRLALTAVGRQADPGRALRQAQVLNCLRDGALAREDLLERGASSAVLRSLLDKGWIEPAMFAASNRPDPGPRLNAEQRVALAHILRARHRYCSFLLAGVTGSGKTEVYLQAARALLRRAAQVLILVPEIGLTPQLIRRVEARLGLSAAVYHSDLSEGERLACWQAAAAGQARVIIGTRSAVFLPMPRLGLIVVDEEHDASFKQQDGARYHGRDLAVMRAHLRGIPIVLGSATPSLESLNNARGGRYQFLSITRRAGGAEPPRWSVLDLRGQRGSLHPSLVGAIERHLKANGQVLIYRNRRGYAPVLICPSCGWTGDCHRCDAHMTVHQAIDRLQCHHCGASRRLPPRCPDCGEPDLQTLGAGTERLEEQLKARFPDFPVYRVDRDSMRRRDQLAQLLDELRREKACILVGTQMLAKGHHLPGVTLAAVLDVDQSLFSADFRAPERLGQAVCQVAGRAGRGERPGEFILQSRQPEHPLLLQLCQSDYLGFAQRLLDERAAAALPPAQALAMLRAEAHDPQKARAFLEAAARGLAGSGLQVQGPVPAILGRRGGYSRFQLWLQASERARLLQVLPGWVESLHALPEARRVRWHADMDPLEL